MEPGRKEWGPLPARLADMLARNERRMVVTLLQDTANCTGQPSATRTDPGLVEVIRTDLAEGIGRRLPRDLVQQMLKDIETQIRADIVLEKLAGCKAHIRRGVGGFVGFAGGIRRPGSGGSIRFEYQSC